MVTRSRSLSAISALFRWSSATLICRSLIWIDRDCWASVAVTDCQLNKLPIPCPRKVLNRLPKMSLKGLLTGFSTPLETGPKVEYKKVCRKGLKVDTAMESRFFFLASSMRSLASWTFWSKSLSNLDEEIALPCNFSMHWVEAIAQGSSPCKADQTSSEISFSIRSSNSGLIKGLGWPSGSSVSSSSVFSGVSLILGVWMSVFGGTASAIGCESDSNSKGIISLALGFNPLDNTVVRAFNLGDRIQFFLRSW